MPKKRVKHRSLLSFLPSNWKDSGHSVDSSPTLNYEDSSPSPLKKRRLNNLLSPDYEKYDSTGLVPFYSSVDQVPEHLKKYYSQRLRLFSRYAEGCLLDEEGWFSVTPEKIANQIAERCRCDVVLDAFCGVGGNAIAFARTCERVIAIDNSPIRLALARHNAALYGVVDRIEFILGDFVSFVESNSHHLGKIDVVFLSPPWGGVDYLSFSPTKKSLINANQLLASSDDPEDGRHTIQQEYHMENMSPLHGQKLFELARSITPHVAFYVPRNQDVTEMAELVTPSSDVTPETVEIEEEWMGNKLKALTCYFGGLAKEFIRKSELNGSLNAGDLYTTQDFPCISSSERSVGCQDSRRNAIVKGSILNFPKIRPLHTVHMFNRYPDRFGPSFGPWTSL